MNLLQMAVILGAAGLTSSMAVIGPMTLLELKECLAGLTEKKLRVIDAERSRVQEHPAEVSTPR